MPVIINAMEMRASYNKYVLQVWQNKQQKLFPSAITNKKNILFVSSFIEAMMFVCVGLPNFVYVGDHVVAKEGQKNMPPFFKQTQPNKCNFWAALSIQSAVLCSAVFVLYCDVLCSV